MERKCIRCGENMILDCDLKIYGNGSIFTHKQNYYVYKEGKTGWGDEEDIKIAVCPECGYIEPYVKNPKNLLK